MAGADEMLFLPEKAMVLDELIQVAKYCNMRKSKSDQPDHDTECINPWQLYDFYFANMDLILWLKPGIPFNVIVTTDVLTMLGKFKAVLLCAYGHPIRWPQPRHLKKK